MTTVRRLDASTSHTTTIVDGVLTAPARLTRAGVFVYVLSDGSLSKEWRAPEEVFAPESIATLDANNYLTLGHPANGWVDGANYRAENRGSVSGAHRDGDYLAANVKVVDAEAVDTITNGVIELSCGYTATRTPTPGLVVTDPCTGETITCDATMSNIKYNHVAIVTRGRAGSECRVLLDSAPDVGVQMEPEIKLDVVESPVTEVIPEVKPDVEPIALPDIAPVAPEAEVAPEVKAEVKVDLQPLLDAANASVSTLQAQVEALQVQLAQATSPQHLDTLVADRSNVVAIAREYLITTDAVDTRTLKTAILHRINSSLRLDSVADTDLDTIFVAVVAQREAPVAKPEITTVVALPVDPLTAAYAARKATFGY